MSIIAQPYFWDEQAAHVKLAQIVWPAGPKCPRCGATDRIGAVIGKGARAGLKFCCRCRKQFRATMGTLLEGSHVPVHKWLQACYLLTACDNPISAHLLHLKLEITNKTALRVVHELIPALAAARRKSPRTAARRKSATEASASRVTENADLASGAAGGRRGEPRAMQQTLPPRQYLGFIETVRAFGGSNDEDRFDQILSRLGSRRTASRRSGTDPAISSPSKFGRGAAPAPAAPGPSA
jgi:transposase-like protein